MIETKDGAKYVLMRDEVMQSIGDSAKNATDSPEDFAQFTEQVENVKPEEKEQMVQGDGYADGAVVYSGSVFVSADTVVTHPKTGERVRIGRYAEALGYGHLLNTSIQCTIRKSGSGYVATASAGGAVIASRTLSSQAELQSSINLIRAYS